MSSAPRPPTPAVSPEGAPPRPDETLGSIDATAPTLNYADLLSAPLSPDELGWLAHYRVTRLVGRGGMGVVFQAEDTHLRRVVALKVILPQFAANPRARERFLREARACAVLRSDHVITIYQVGQDRDVPFLAMEFLEGQSLEEDLRARRPLPVRDVLRVGRDVADGLAAAHAQGLIHRDVKPANLWREAGSGRVKILDFGLAREAGAAPGLTCPGDVVGTPDFMSPEQARGDVLDARADLFSLGAVLYALATGCKPFRGRGVMAVLTALAVDTPRPPQELNPDLPPALAELIGRLLEKEPANRPASAAEVCEALAAIEAGGTSPSAALPRTQVVTPCARGRRARWLAAAGVGAACALFGALGVLAGWFAPHSDGGPGAVGRPAPSGPPIRVGVLHSRTGTMALSERPVIDAVLLAVDEINERGGVLGRPVEAVLADGESEEAVFARRAEELITRDRVSALFGCWTSASRKAVVPVVERHGHLLFYPVQFEGAERSPNVVYLGPVPNQQILPALRWLVGFENKRRWFLVGSDYVYPATANAVIREEAKARGCEVVGERYLLLGSTEVADVVRAIVKSRPDLIVNTVNGDTNVALFRALRRAGVTPRQAPALSTSISEEELMALGPQATAGDYVAASYFQSLDTPRNRAFVARFQKRYGAERVISDAMETAYTGVHLWARAVQAAGRPEPGAVRASLRGQTYDAPQGPVRIDPVTLHAVQTARVGRVGADGRLTEVYVSPQPVAAQAFPGERGPAEWATFLDGLHRRWGGRWSNPGP